MRQNNGNTQSQNNKFFNTNKNDCYNQITYEKNGVEMIVDNNGTLWVNKKH